MRAGEGLTRATNLEDQLALAWEFVREQLRVSTFFVALYDRQTETLRFPLAYDEGQRIEIPDRCLGADRTAWGVAGYVVKKGQEIYWPSRKEAEKQCQAFGLESIQIGKPCQSCFYLPLKVGDEVIGAISVQSYTPHAFTPILLDACRALGSQLSVALENTRLFSELAEAKDWREALIENAFDAVIAIDQNHRITVFNRRAEEMLGWKSEEMKDKTVARLHTDVEMARQILDRVNREGAVSGWEVELKHRDGTPIPALLSATLIRDSQGRPIGQAGFMRDLRQVRLFEDRQRALIKVSQAITGILEVDKVLDLVVRSAVAAFPTAQGGSIHLYDERAGKLCMRANTFGYSQEAIEASCMNPGEGIAGWVFLHKQPAVVDDIHNAPQYKKIEHPQAPLHKSMICVPLQIRGHAIGTLSLDNLESTGAFHADDLELLSAFADQAAIALDNARRVQELEQMRQAAEAMSQALEPRQALQQIVNSAAQVLQADSVAIWSYDDVRDIFIPEELVAVGIPAEELERFREEEPKPGRTADRVMSQGYLAVTGITQPEYSFLGESTRSLLDRIGVQSFQGIALQVGDERLGVLYANYTHLRTFGAEEEKKLRTFASHAALALKNARLLAQMRRTREAAGVIADVTVQEDLNQTLRTIARHTQQVLHSDAVTLYTYNEATGRLNDEWAAEILDPRAPDSAYPPHNIGPASVVWSILGLAEPPYYHLAEDHAPDDRLLGGRFVQEEGMQAAIGIQLRVGEHKVGVMFVNFRSLHRFTADEIATIQLFANQAAVAIRNARQYDEIVRDANLRKGLLRAGQEIMALQEPKAVLQNIVNLMQEVLACDVVTLYTYDHDRGEIGFPAHVAGELRDRESLGELGYVSKESVVGRLLASGKAHFAADAPNDPVMSAGGFVAREGVRSSAGIPLQFGNRIIGIVFVNYRTFHPFPIQEQEALLLFATQAAVAIRNAQQFEQINRKTISLEALYEAGKVLSGTLALDDILNRIVEQARSLTGRYGKQARFSHLALKEERWLRFKAAFPPECLPGLQKGVGDIDLEGDGPIGVTGRVVKTGESQLVGDVTQDPDYITYDPETRSELAVPIKLGGEIIGVINVEHSDTNAFDQDDRRDLESLAAQAALAIQNARRYEELRRAKGLVGARTALAWMGMASSTWRHAIDKHALTIREQAQLLGKELSQGRVGKQGRQMAEGLAMIEKLANQILAKPLVPPLTSEESTRTVAVDELVGERARQLWQNDPYRAATLKLDLQSGAATVRASPEWLRRAFDILVDNAVNAVAGQEIQEVTIGTRSAGSDVEILVSDTGPGIPPEIQAKLGLEAIEKPEDAKGLGMGLLMAQTIVQTYGGEIRVESTGPTGTTMVIRLPLEAQVR